jgi:hypothetical protein
MPGARSDRARCAHTIDADSKIDEQYERPVRIVAFNTMEGWSREVTVYIADELADATRGVQRGTGLDPQLYGSPPALIGGTIHPPSLFLLDGRYPL